MDVLTRTQSIHDYCINIYRCSLINTYLINTLLIHILLVHIKKTISKNSKQQQNDYIVDENIHCTEALELYTVVACRDLQHQPAVLGT